MTTKTKINTTKEKRELIVRVLISKGWTSEKIEQFPYRLTDQEKIVLRERFFKGKTLRESAKHLLKGPERVRQIESLLIRKLDFCATILKSK